MSRQLVPGSSISAGQFLFLPDVQGKRLELNDGQVVEIPGSGARLNEIAFNLAMLLRHHANRNDLGWASGDGAGYVLPGELETVVIPDASFVGKERIPLDGRQEGIRPFPPDLVVEIGLTTRPSGSGPRQSLEISRSRSFPYLGSLAGPSIDFGVSAGRQNIRTA